jgi:ribosomal protein L2
MAKKTTKLDVLDIIERSLRCAQNESQIDDRVKSIEYDGDNHDGCIQILMEDGTSWFISSQDIKSGDDLLRDK